MKKLSLTVSLLLATLLTANAYAQTKGEADAAGSKALPAKAATKEEKAEAKDARKKEGAAAAKSSQAMAKEGETKATGGTMKVSAEDKKAAAMKRKTEASDAVKKGETQSRGEASK